MTEKKGSADGIPQGGQPVLEWWDQSGDSAKRKRAYHRALKRGAPWALHKQTMYRLIQETCDIIWRPSPFLSMVGLSDWLPEPDPSIDPMFGVNRTTIGIECLRPNVPKPKWYQRIEWLQRFARKILVE